MEFLISVKLSDYMQEDFKFVKIIKDMDKEGVVAGFEISEIYSQLNRTRVNHLIETAKKTKEYGYRLNIHAPDIKNADLGAMLYAYNEVAKVMNERVNVTVHPIYSDDFDNSIGMTVNRIRKMRDIIEQKHYCLDLTLENLNAFLDIVSDNNYDVFERYKRRINIDRIDEILSLTDVGFCWDVGHSYNDKIPMKLSNLQLQRLRNVHIHDVRGTEDHQPFHEIPIREYMQYLRDVSYNNTIVIEIALDELGNDREDAVKNFYKQLKRVHGEYCRTE